MDTLLFTIEEVFYIKNLGTVLYPGISLSDSRIKVGQRITVLRPDGHKLRTAIKDFPMINRQGYKEAHAIVLPQNITADEIPVGSTIWITKTD